MSALGEILSGPGAMPFATTVLRVRPGRRTDPYNPERSVEDWESVDTAELTGFVASSSSSETPDGLREEVSSSAVLTVADPSADVRRGDVIEAVPPDGRRWRVVGFPTTDASPFTGWRPTLEARLEEVVG